MFDAYARSTLDRIYGEKLNAAKMLKAEWLDSRVFLNRGDHFEAHSLPIEAQVAPAFGVCVADFDGDGNEDVFLSQNFFATTPETSRYDAGRGLILLGDGHGGFAAVPGQQSGIKIYGEQRGAATCDYDHDGRIDLAVGQNSAPIKLFRNETAKPGLRIRVTGPPGNPDGIGAVIRIGRTKLGAAREIHAGSGYWSQDSAVQVMTAIGPAQVHVSWPGGKRTISSLPAQAQEISVDIDGALRVLR
jgi:enediyne biosynthesis protein E4